MLLYTYLYKLLVLNLFLKGKYYKYRIVTVAIYLLLYIFIFINTYLNIEVPPSIFFSYLLQQFIWVDIGFSKNIG